MYYEAQCGNTPDDLDHAVLAVGYGVDAAVEHIRARTVYVCDILLHACSVTATDSAGWAVLDCQE